MRPQVRYESAGGVVWSCSRVPLLGGLGPQIHQEPHAMFVRAIEKVCEFTRPIHSFVRYHSSPEPIAGAGTLFFVNDQGWALTCAHVAKLVADAEAICQRYDEFQQEFRARRGSEKENKLRKELARKFGYEKGSIAELRNMFVNCAEGSTAYVIKADPELDVALIQFEGFTSLNPTSFAKFAKSGAELKAGKFLCRVGYPFPEFKNFRYDPVSETTSWTNTGRQDTPFFPLEGMVTRQLVNDAGNVIGIELSTPGLRGQSGGPVFDSEGCIWGMQASTAHLDLDFDVNQEVMRGGAKKRVHDSAFLHVGRAVHLDGLKKFMTANGVSFDEA